MQVLYYVHSQMTIELTVDLYVDTFCNEFYNPYCTNATEMSGRSASKRQVE